MRVGEKERHVRSPRTLSPKTPPTLRPDSPPALSPQRLGGLTQSVEVTLMSRVSELLDLLYRGRKETWGRASVGGWGVGEERGTRVLGVTGEIRGYSEGSRHSPSSRLRPPGTLLPPTFDTSHSKGFSEERKGRGGGN